MFPRPPRALHGPLLGLAYLAAWLLLAQSNAPYWALPAGLRFGALLLAPMRCWPWLIAAEWGGTAIADAWLGQADIGWEVMVLGDMPDVLVVAGCIAAFRGTGLRPSLRHPEDAARLLAAALVTATASTGADAALVLLMHPNTHLEGMSGFLGDELLGAYLGILLLAPVLILLFRERLRGHALNRMLLDGLVVMLPSLVVLLLLMQLGSPLSEFARILALAPVLYFAFRHGWRGAALSMLIASAAMVLFSNLTTQLAEPAQAHLFLAVAGTATLMLGAAIDALRQSGEHLAVQNARLEGANRRLDQLARQLSDAARRNLRVEEDHRRHMAAELHDELGQNLTAIQTRVKLAQARLHEAGLGDVATSINDILSHMRAAVRRLLDSLRPTVLDEFGLARALEEGPIRDLLRTAGIVYRFDLHGDLRPLDEDTCITIYRVAQEAATNAVRHAMAQELRLHLRIGQRGGGHVVLLDIRDDGIGLPGHAAPRRGGRGMQSMRDRVTALGGIFRIRPSVRGTRLHILLRAPALEGQPPRNLSDTAIPSPPLGFDPSDVGESPPFEDGESGTIVGTVGPNRAAGRGPGR
jgi:two-component system sensor histidine kinase UhpB